MHGKKYGQNIQYINDEIINLAHTLGFSEIDETDVAEVLNFEF